MTHSADPPADPAAAKRRLRAKIRASRATRPQSDREQFAERLAGLAHERLVPGATVALFFGVDDEPNTAPLVRRLHAEGIRVLLPIVNPDWSLDWAQYVGDDMLATSPHGLSEPTGERLGTAGIAEASLVLIPALAVDSHGRRLGQGAGCYDRALRFVLPQTPVLAVVFDDERLTDDLPEEPHDRRADGVVP